LFGPAIVSFVVDLSEAYAQGFFETVLIMLIVIPQCRHGRIAGEKKAEKALDA
jgi:hypothetical protein